MRLTIDKPRTWRGVGSITYVRRNGNLIGRIRNGKSLTVEIPDTDFVLDVDALQFIVRDLPKDELTILLRPDSQPLATKYAPCRAGKPLPVYEDPMQGVNPCDDAKVSQLPLYVQHYAMCRRMIGADTLGEAVLENGTIPLLQAMEAIGCDDMAERLRRVHEQIPEADAAVDECSNELDACVEALCHMEDDAWMAAMKLLNDLSHEYLIAHSKA